MRVGARPAGDGLADAVAAGGGFTGIRHSRLLQGWQWAPARGFAPCGPAHRRRCGVLGFSGMPTETARRSRIDAPYLRTLRTAVKVAGSEAALAEAWGVAPEKLANWLAGEVVLPVDFYVAALRVLESNGEGWKTESL